MDIRIEATCCVYASLILVIFSPTATAHPSSDSSTHEADLSLWQQYRQPIAKWPPFTVDKGVRATEIGSLPALPDAPWHTQARQELGHLLFFDPRLSKSGQIACASCHDPELGWADGRRVPFGHDRTAGRRNAMTLLNTAYFSHWSWDGRANSLIEQVLLAIRSPIEMNADPLQAIKRLTQIPAYRQGFEQAFGSSEITPEELGRALASFVRTIISSPSRFDRFVRGDFKRLTDQEIEGLHLFRTRARCMNCHHGPLFSDRLFHHTGLSYYGRKFEDLGRYEVTGKQTDRGKFRTPSLRELQHTGPWMHNGLFVNMRGVLNMYNHGITARQRPKPGAPPLSPLIQPLNLERRQLAALEAFLMTLSRRPHAMRPPKLPDRVPELEQVTPSLRLN